MSRSAGPPTASAEGPSLIDRLKRRFLYGLGFGVAVLVAVSLLGEGPALLETLGRFRWELLPVILVLILGNYALRFVKWELYLRWLDINQLQTRTSLGIYLAGMSMAITPGKVGEVLKAYLLRRANSTPVSVSAPIVVAERVTDGIAMLGLASIGLVSVRYGWQALGVLAVGAAAGIILLRRRSLMLAALRSLGRIPRLAGRINAVHLFYESTYALFRPGRLAISIALGLVSWAGECAAFFLILVGLGFTPTANLFITATFVLATATILGSVSMLPGGLGATEASVAGLLLLLIRDPGMTQETAAAATLLVRLVTLWFGVLLGLGALLLIERHLTRLEAESAEPATDMAQTAG